MIKTQIQFPDELYRRAKRFGTEREMSLAEMIRRGLELLLERYPSEGRRDDQPWSLPRFRSRLLKETPEELRDILDEEREDNSLRGIIR